MPQQAGQTLPVPIDPEVVVVALPTTPQPAVLHRQLLVPLTAAPGGDGLDGPAQARAPRLTRPIPPTPPRPPPVQPEAQEVEGARTLPLLLSSRRAPEVEQAGLVRVEGQPVALQPLRQHRQHALGILPVLEADDEVVGVPDEAGPAA